MSSSPTWTRERARPRPATSRASSRRKPSRIVQHHGGDLRQVAGDLRAKIDAHGSGLADEDALWRPAVCAARGADARRCLPGGCWCSLCQGEGAQLDIPMTRHPMWEWLFSHPAPPSAIFFAEMLAPIAANPLFVTAPILPGALFALAYGWPIGIAGAVLVGVPLAVALACLGRALEIRIVLGFGPRVRGALLGLMSWFGFASMMLTLFLAARAVRQRGSRRAGAGADRRFFPGRESTLCWASTRTAIWRSGARWRSIFPWRPR